MVTRRLLFGVFAATVAALLAPAAAWAEVSGTVTAEYSGVEDLTCPRALAGSSSGGGACCA